jgi:hypothetical protein
MPSLAEILEERGVAEQKSKVKLSSLVATLSEQNAFLSEQNAVLSAQNAVLSEQNTVLSEQNAVLSEQIEALTLQNVTLSLQNTMLATEKLALEQHDATKSQEFMTQKEAWSKEKTMLVERQDEQDQYIDHVVAQYKQKLEASSAEHERRYKLVRHQQSLLQLQVSKYEKNEQEQLRIQTKALLERRTQFKQQEREAQALMDMIGAKSPTS